jgi:hypothetical protein
MKVVWYADHPTQVFDLGADPRELEDVAPARPDVIAATRAELERYAQEAAPPRPVSDQLEYDPRFVDRLRALGYVTGDADAPRSP